MKTCFFLLVFLISSISFAQNNHIVNTEDGRRVLLKADFTWEYIDAENPAIEHVATSASEPLKNKACNVDEDFVEPKLDKKIQTQLKKGRATISHVKKRVAKDFDCTVDDILLLSFSEQKGRAVYHFCANGTKVSYKRIGNSIVKSVKLF